MYVHVYMWQQIKPNQTPLYVMCIATPQYWENRWMVILMCHRTDRNEMCIYLSLTIIFLTGKWCEKAFAIVETIKDKLDTVTLEVKIH